MAPRPQLKEVIWFLLAATGIGVLGYTAIEHWTLLDALYMTVTTLATVGYGEVHPLSPAGRVFTMVLILIGVGAVFYALTASMQWVLEGQFGQAVGRRRMEKRIASLRDHFILCGYGRVGKQISAEFKRERIEFVVIDVNQESLERAIADGCLAVLGDASAENVLKRAGLMRARGLITAVDSDAHNVFVTLSAHVARPDLPIVARANFEDSVPKLRQAGATRVISPYSIGGRRMALAALRPLAVEYVDTILRGDGIEVLLEDIELGPGSPLVGITVGEVRARYDGVTLMAVRKGDQLITNPPVEQKLEAGDEIVALGLSERLRALEGVA